MGLTEEAPCVRKKVAWRPEGNGTLSPLIDGGRMRPCLILCLSAGVILAAAPGQKAGPAQIARLVEQLGDDDFGTREAATRRLKEIGEPALASLHKAMASKDLEVRRRAREIVSVIENRLYGEQLRLTGHTSDVMMVVVAGDGKRVLTASRDKTIRLWDAGTGKELRLFKGHTDRIVGVALSPDGKRILSGCDDRTLRLWDATTGKQLDKLTGHAGAVYSVAFGPKGSALSGGADQTMHHWDLKTGRNLGVFTGHGGLVRTVAYSDRAKLAATSSNDQAIRLWNLETGQVVRTLSGHSGGFDLNISFSPDGKRLLSSNDGDHTVRIWDVATGKELKRFAVAGAYCAAFSADGKRIVCGGYSDRTVRVLEAETGRELRKYEGHTGSVFSVAFFPDGKRIVSAGGDGTVRIWGAPR
jgi:WD40 repeat protein